MSYLHIEAMLKVGESVSVVFTRHWHNSLPKYRNREIQHAPPQWTAAIRYRANNQSADQEKIFTRGKNNILKQLIGDTHPVLTICCSLHLAWCNECFKTPFWKCVSCILGQLECNPYPFGFFCSRSPKMWSTWLSWLSTVMIVQLKGSKYPLFIRCAPRGNEQKLHVSFTAWDTI